MNSVSRAEVCAVACAELFRDAGEIMVSPMANMVSIGARLARLTFSPDIVLSDGEARLLADTPALGAAGAIEGWMPFGRVFETLAWGRRHVVMGANQVDRYGNQNLSAFGPLQHPTRQMFGVRGAPGNTINHATSYWVGNHSKRVFCDTVDVVSGIGWDKVDPDNPAYRFVNVYRVVSNLGVFDFNGPDHTMRAVSLHPGIDAEQVRENTSFEVHGLDEAAGIAAGNRRRTEADSRGHRPQIAAGQGSSLVSRLRTPLTELIGIEHPVVQTGMGWVAGARLVAATSNAGGLGILASATMTLDELQTAVTKVKAATDKPFGINIRADAGDAIDRIDLLIREGVKVASFALAPKPDLIAKLKEAGVVVIPSVGLAKHAKKVAGWGADAVIVQGGEGGGHTGPIATTLLLPSVLDAVDIPVVAAGGFFDGRGLAAALSYGAAGVAMGTRFLLTSDSTVPDDVKRRYLESGLDGTVVSTRVDGMPHRVLRTGLVEKLESGSRLRGFGAAVRNAQKFKKMSKMTWRSMISDGLEMRHGKELTWSQVVMAANTPMLLKAGLVEGNTDAGVLASGQVAGILDDLPSCAELVDSIVADAVKHLRAAAGLVTD